MSGDIRAIFTIGHSTLPVEKFVQLLEANGVELLVDIRSMPRSRRNPQFNRDALPEPLGAVGIGYLHAPELGGMRHPRSDSRNGAWQNDGFRGYADYMQTEEFKAALDRAVGLAAEKPTALMCAEAVPWKCHRSLVSDALSARGIEVREIVSDATPHLHKVTPFARIRGSEVTYPRDSTRELFDAG